MIRPVSIGNNFSQVQFKGGEETPNTPVNTTTTQPPQQPSFCGAFSDKKSAGKTVLKTIGSLLVASAALLGLYKFKGAKWIASENKGILATAKKWSVKPGEYVNKYAYEPVVNFGKTALAKVKGLFPKKA